MTTIVTISTGDHPARVIGYPFADHQPVDGGASRTVADLAPHSRFEVSAHAGEAIGVIELPLPVAAQEAAPVNQGEAVSEEQEAA